MDARRLGVGLYLSQAFLTAAATDYLSDDDYEQLVLAAGPNRPPPNSPSRPMASRHPCAAPPPGLPSPEGWR